MGYFNRDSNNRSGRDNRGGGRGFGGGRDRGGRDSRPSFRNDGPREMFKTVCSNCGKECEVPFKPTSGKPVYCSDCFEKMGGRNSDGGRPERNDKQSLPFQGRPRPSFDRHQAPDPRIDSSKQFEELGKKLDKIIALLTPKTEETPKLEEVKVEKAFKTPKVKKAKVIKEEVVV